MAQHVQYIYCPVNVWTYVSDQSALLPFVTVYSRDGVLEVNWRRYFDVPPFFEGDTTILARGRNTFAAVPPSAINTWWFQPPAVGGWIGVTAF